MATMRKILFHEWGINSQSYWMILIVLSLVAALGGLAFFYMEHQGHWVTGMTNQVVWGTPHVFAVFLIVAASGALNVASIGSVFNKKIYVPLSQLSALLAVSLLVGGLVILVLDLGRPDRLIVAMTSYNFKSIFAWNIILYNGFIVLTAFYQWTIMDRHMKSYYRFAGVSAFAWRLILTTGTGSIFGFLVARQGYDAAILAPWFITMSFGYGLAIYVLILFDSMTRDNREIGDAMICRLKNLLVIFILTNLLFLVIYHLTNLYATENHGWERFILLDGGVYTVTFWLGQVMIGIVLPLAISIHPVLCKSKTWLSVAAAMVIIGGFATMYVLIIGGQAFPMQMFPDKTILSSGFYDGVGGQVYEYRPSAPEVLLGLGGIAVTLLITVFGMRMFKVLPTSLSDEATEAGNLDD